MSQHKILIVEDDLDINNLISRYLQKQNYSVHSAFNGKEALELLTSNDYHLIILDLMLPELNGYEIIEIIRKQKNVPVLIVSAKSDEIDKIEALDLGADDYITKPFTVGELLARVNAQIRRFVLLNGSNQELHNMLKFKNLLLNLETYEAFKDDIPIALSAKEFEILRVFIENPNKVFQNLSFTGPFGKMSISGRTMLSWYKLTACVPKSKIIHQTPIIFKQFGVSVIDSKRIGFNF